MNNEGRIGILKDYIERTKLILTLTSPPLNKIESAEDYRLYLQRSFQKIGELGQQNVKDLDEFFFPLLAADVELSDEEADDLREFSSMLIDTTSMENIDIPLIFMIAEKLLQRAEKHGDIKELIVAADNMVIAAYMMMNLSLRFYPDLDGCFRYRDIGLRAAYMILEHLPKDKFAALPDDECRELVLINSRYMRCLFEWGDQKDRSESNAHDLRLMKQSIALANDPFYREMMPDYLWDIHVFRALQYIADFTEDNNVHRFTREQLEDINECTKALDKFLEDHPEIQGCPPTEREFYLIRNAYLVGQMSNEDYQKELIRLMNQLDLKDFSARSMFISLTTPLEYIFTLDKNNLSEDQCDTMRQMYKDIASYSYQMPKTGVLSFMLNFLADLLKNYIEVPGGMSFRAMCRQLMAAMHPPTYVHTLNVAAISRFLAGKLIERNPDLFCGIEDTVNAADVLNRKNELEDFVYNSALLHDVGKLFIVETILTYGRNLVDSEFELIKAHTEVGAALLRRFKDTAKYADVALGHQLWYNGEGGYPPEARHIDPVIKPVVDIVAVADCLDAATDTVGRSYKKGKSLDEVLDEMRAGSGTRYAPFVVELFEDASVIKELQRILTEGRDENYRITFSLLKEL